MNKERIFTIIEVGNDNDIPSRTYDITLMVAVVINIFIAIFDTFPQSVPYLHILNIIEGITVLFFTVDYILRIWTAPFLYKAKPAGRARWKFLWSWQGIVDFLSCIPYFLPILFPSGAAALRMFRIIRILRVFRIRHYSDPLTVIGKVLKRKKGQLLSSIFIILILMIAASLVMYSLEHNAQPEVFTNAFSGFWWAASTLLTVGYGDIVPITILGKFCGTIITFLGVFLIAIPTGILSAGFVEYTSHKRSESPSNYCPHCGKKL